ncbi:hypothetical protein BY996DRAFT_6494732 [Phakopsora pachyrhizi]|nr:hypothetical protein BY996DRAFT_6494732 [Phakopsora pachyrhizi]
MARLGWAKAWLGLAWLVWAMVWLGLVRQGRAMAGQGYAGLGNGLARAELRARAGVGNNPVEERRGGLPSNPVAELRLKAGVGSGPIAKGDLLARKQIGGEEWWAYPMAF